MDRAVVCLRHCYCRRRRAFPSAGIFRHFPRRVYRRCDCVVAVRRDAHRVDFFRELWLLVGVLAATLEREATPLANKWIAPIGFGLPAETLRAGDRVEALIKAGPPRNYLDPGAFGERKYLSRRHRHFHRLARWRGALLRRVDSLFAAQPERAAILRAMLLGDRGSVDSDTAAAFQRTGTYHVLMVAGLQVAAPGYFVFWASRRLRISRLAQTVLTLAVLLGYAGIVKDRVPILRAVLVGAFFLVAGLLSRRVELLNAIGVAVLLVLVWRPSELADASFQLSFRAAGVIAALLSHGSNGAACRGVRHSIIWATSRATAPTHPN